MRRQVLQGKYIKGQSETRSGEKDFRDTVPSQQVGLRY
jgi:hypothetical protein